VEQARRIEAVRTAAIERNQRIVALAACPPTAHDRVAAVESLLALLAAEQAAMSEVNWATVMDRLARLVRGYPELVDSLRQDARFLAAESALLHTMLPHAAPRVRGPRRPRVCMRHLISRDPARVVGRNGRCGGAAQTLTAPDGGAGGDARHRR
jgi:hypothetical protein